MLAFYYYEDLHYHTLVILSLCMLLLLSTNNDGQAHYLTAGAYQRRQCSVSLRCQTCCHAHVRKSLLPARAYP